MATAAQCEGNPMPDTTDSRPPRISAGEKATLVEFLNYLRHAIVSNLEGAPEPQVRTTRVPSGTSVLGLVKHLGYVERFYFLGEEVSVWSATFRPTPDDTIDGVLASYREAISRGEGHHRHMGGPKRTRSALGSTSGSADDAVDFDTHDRGDGQARRPCRHPA